MFEKLTLYCDSYIQLIPISFVLGELPLPGVEVPVAAAGLIQTGDREEPEGQGQCHVSASWLFGEMRDRSQTLGRSSAVSTQHLTFRGQRRQPWSLRRREGVWRISGMGRGRPRRDNPRLAASTRGSEGLPLPSVFQEG